MKSLKVKKSPIIISEKSHIILNKNNVNHLNKQVLDILKKSSLSITTPRKMILALLINEHGPFTAEEIFQKLPTNSCDQATVYRCLNQFMELQIVSNSFLFKDIVHYEFNDPHHHHHHVICKTCKKIESLNDCFIEKIESSLEKRGYKQIQHRLEFFAVCSKCNNKDAL